VSGAQSRERTQSGHPQPRTAGIQPQLCREREEARAAEAVAPWDSSHGDVGRYGIEEFALQATERPQDLDALRQHRTGGVEQQHERETPLTRVGDAADELVGIGASDGTGRVSRVGGEHHHTPTLDRALDGERMHGHLRRAHERHRRVGVEQARHALFHRQLEEARAHAG